MSKNKIIFNKVNIKENNITPLGSLEIDFKDIILDGKVLYLKGHKNFEFIVRELGLALLSYTKNFKSEISSMGSLKVYRSHIYWFTEFLNEVIADEKKGEIKLKSITSEIFEQFYTWSHNREDFSSATQSKSYHSIRRLFEHQRDIGGSIVTDQFTAIQKSPTGFVTYAGAEVYEDEEIEELLTVCRSEINSLLKRLNQGSIYLSKGEDPSNRAIRNTVPWGKIENILWYIEHSLNGRILTKAQLTKEKRYQFINVLSRAQPQYRWNKKEVYEYLYPSRSDLLAFLIMLSVKTGLNKESITTLKRDCIDEASVTDTSFKLKFSKAKTHTLFDSRAFNTAGRFSVYHLVKEVLKITEPLIAHIDEANRNFLFIGVVNNSIKGTVQPFSDGSYLTNMLNAKEDRGWLYSHGLGHITYSFDKMRETWATTRYKQTGNLGKVQKDLRHKDAGTSNLHYIDSKATQDIHEQTILDVQNSLIFSGTTRGNIDDVIIHEDENTGKNNFNNEKIKEQEIFFALCKDFYNRPGGAENTACDQPWSCFTCKNGVWTTNILPRVIAFYNFMEQQKASLPIADWEAKFSLPYLTIKNYILPQFKKETITWAERESLSIDQYIPNSIRMT